MRNTLLPYQDLLFLQSHKWRVSLGCDAFEEGTQFPKDTVSQPIAIPPEFFLDFIPTPAIVKIAVPRKTRALTYSQDHFPEIVSVLMTTQENITIFRPHHSRRWDLTRTHYKAI